MPNNSRTKPRRFLTTPAAADYIHRHRSSLDKWRAENIVLPYYQDGHKVLYCVDDLDAYLDSLKVDPVAYGVAQGRPKVAQSEDKAA